MKTKCSKWKECEAKGDYDPKTCIAGIYCGLKKNPFTTIASYTKKKKYKHGPKNWKRIDQ